jgi:DNA-binding transcriptional LysR family regulator
MRTPPQLSIDTAEFKIFIAVADSGNFSRAAEQLGISQPSVSLRIKKLEAQVGFRLFHRSTRSVVLTIEGERFREGLIGFVGHLNELLDELRGGKQQRASTIHLAATPLLSAVTIPGLIGKFKQIYPWYSIVLQDSTHQEALMALESGQADVAVMGLEGEHPTLKFEELLADECVAVVPVNHELAHEPFVDIDDLARHPLLTLSLHWSGWGALLREFERRHLNVRPAFEANTVFTLLGMVEAGLGITIVPSIVSARLDARTLVAVKLRGITISRTIGIVRLRDKMGSAAVRTFCAFLRKELTAKAPTPSAAAVMEQTARM